MGIEVVGSPFLVGRTGFVRLALVSELVRTGHCEGRRVEMRGVGTGMDVPCRKIDLGGVLCFGLLEERNELGCARILGTLFFDVKIVQETI